jgi:PilZ domain
MLPELTTEDPNRELRRYRRVDLFQEIVCDSGDVQARSQVADLSVGGMFVDHYRPPFPRGTRVTARFALREDEPRMVVDADVHYVQNGIGMGMRFADMRDDDRDWIAAFVEESAHRKRVGGPPLRKSARVCVEVPIRLWGAHTTGLPFDERTSLITLSKHGACLVSGVALEVGMKLLLETARGLVFKSNVVWVGTAATRSEGQAGVQCRGLAQSLGFQFP